MNFGKTKKTVKDNNKADSALLRQKAEELLKKKSSGTVSPLAEVESSRLIHELEVHQIELELQMKNCAVHWQMQKLRMTNISECTISHHQVILHFPIKGKSSN